MKLKLNNLRLTLPQFTLSVDVELSKVWTAIYGPSGAGKTSFLDIIAGLRQPQNARIALNDTVLTDSTSGIALPVRARGIGYLPQDLALFPHLSVKENVEFGAARSLPNGAAIDHARVLDVLEIEALLQRSIGELSGGERQRVAMARALMSSPRLLLLDEPLASLDTALKQRIIPYLVRLRDEFQIPTLYVTHDADEVRALCGEVLVLHRGSIVARGNPDEIAL